MKKKKIKWRQKRLLKYNWDRYYATIDFVTDDLIAIDNYIKRFKFVWDNDKQIWIGTHKKCRCKVCFNNNFEPIGVVYGN